MKIQDLDKFFNKFIDKKLQQKNQTKPMEIILDEFQEIMKDEDFDKKEFDFSKKMLRLKRKYPLPRFNDEKESNEGLNRIKEHTEITNQAYNINIESGVSIYLHQQKEAQKELEKEQLAQNIYHSTIILQNKDDFQNFQNSPQLQEGKNKLQTILFRKSEFKLNQTLKDTQMQSKKTTAERSDSFSKLEIYEMNNENRKKLQTQHHKTIFLNLVDSYERELETIDKSIIASKSNRLACTASKDKSSLIFKTKSFIKPEKLKFVKNLADLADSTNLLSLKAQASKQKNLGLSDIASMKMKGPSSCLKLKEKRKEKSPQSRAKSRYQVHFDYAKAVENQML